MTIGGWIILILSVGSTTLLFLWCLYRVLTDPEEADHLHGTTDIEPGDIEK